MKNSTKDRLQGGAREMKGRVKEAAGVLTGNRRMKSEGQAEKMAGKVERKVGEIRKVLED
jgi:uncharacterized protein YjbJ (UPF0337 family)